jgi:glucose/arabinose dehydrogenase
VKRTAAILSTLVCVAVVGTCACVLLPERFAVNAPLLNMVFGWGGGEPPSDDAFGRRIRAADGFSVGLFASDLSGVRFLRPLPDGSLLASRPREGEVWRLSPDADGDGRADAAAVLLEGLDRPHGLDLHEGWLYVAEGDGIGRVRIDPADGALAGPYERIVDGLPSGGNHWTRTVRIGPDGWMYVSVGSSCNVCFEKDERRAAMLRFRPDGRDGEIYATGLRNSVGFDWQPGTGVLYATDNGRDLLGDDFPPCELNRIERGGFYGWPVANGDRVLDPDVGEGHEERARRSIPPAHAFPAHNAPLGMVFLRGAQWPAEWRGAALVALHGSWNRTRKDGYKVVSLHWQPDGAIEQRDFVVGFLEDEDVIGRPVDVAEGRDGTLYVSDDYAGAIYWVRRGGSGSAEPAAAAATAPGAAAGGVASRGAALWEQHACARCHDAERAEPGVVGAPLRDLDARYDEAGLVAFLAAPTPPMPLPPLDDDERRDLAAYLLERFD